MGKSSEPSKVIFICHRFPMLRMVFKRDNTHIINNAVIREPQEYIGFVKTPYGGRFETSDPVKIAWMRQQPQYAEGVIVEVDESDLDKALADREVDAHPVVSGMQGTMPRAPQPAVAAPAPAFAKTPGAARVPAFDRSEKEAKNPFEISA